MSLKNVNEWDSFVKSSVDQYVLERCETNDPHNIPTQATNTRVASRIADGKLSLIGRNASVWLARPSSNAYQERVFNYAKMIDSPLRRNLDSTKFEMLVLLALNCDFVRSSGKVSDRDMLNALGSATSTRAGRDHLVKTLACDMDDEEVKALIKDINMYADSLEASGTTNEANSDCARQ